MAGPSKCGHNFRLHELDWGWTEGIIVSMRLSDPALEHLIAVPRTFKGEECGSHGLLVRDNSSAGPDWGVCIQLKVMTTGSMARGKIGTHRDGPFLSVLFCYFDFHSLST